MRRFLICLILFVSVPLCVFAQEYQQYNEYLESYDLSAFEDCLDDDTYNALKQLGIDEFDLQNLTSLTINDFAQIIYDMFNSTLETPLQTAVSVLVFVLLSSFFQSFRNSVDSSMTEIFSTASALIITVIISVKISNTIAISATTLSVASDFIYAFIPAFCVIVATSGGITTTFSTNSLLLILSQALSFVSSVVFVPLINCFLAIGICSCLKQELNLGKIVFSLKRLITTAISLCAAGFVSILSIKTAVASRADALGLRSIRFAINSVVPVIGSAISEGLLSIQSYSSLIKTSVGIVGIVAIAFVFLPSIIEVAVWRFILSLCGVVSDVFDDKSVSSVINAFKDSMLLVNVVLILSMVTTIISFGILIAAKTG